MLEAGVHMAGDDTTGAEPNALLAIGYEELPWAPGRAVAVPMSRAQRATIRDTYQASIPPRIGGMGFVLDPEVIAEAEDARAEIVRFDAELSGHFADNEVAPLSSVLLRTESASSSQIENITAGARALALAELGMAKYGSNAGLVTANVDAMNRALALAQDATPETITSVHEALMRGQAHANPGVFRDEQVWIGGHAASPHGATFVPPHHDRVPAAMEDLCQFARRTDLPLVAHVALTHAQFETIHPFNDGNGRTGRALVHAMLKHGGATTRTTVPVSAGLLADTDAYFNALTAYRGGDPNPIVRQFSTASFRAVANGQRLSADLDGIHRRWTAVLTSRDGSAARRALPHLLAHPAVTSSVLADMLKVSQPTADNAIRRLRDTGILTRATGGRRYVAWVATDVIAALDAFGTRARRQRL